MKFRGTENAITNASYGSQAAVKRRSSPVTRLTSGQGLLETIAHLFHFISKPPEVADAFWVDLGSEGILDYDWT